MQHFRIKNIINRIAFVTLAIIIQHLPVLSQSKQPVYMDASKPIEQRVESAMKLMTLAEKVALTHGQSSFSSRGVPRLGIPDLWMDDGPHGVRFEAEWGNYNDAKHTNDSCTAFPALTALAATWNPDCSLMYGKALGEEARYRNKSVLLGPGVNIYRSPLNGRNFEYLGEDPYLASRMAVPYIKGIQQNGVAACVKHFAVNNQETLRFTINVNVSDRALNELYLPAFKAAVQEGGVMTLMAAYNKYNGFWCAENEKLLKTILKQEWGFKGVVISDWGAVHNTINPAKNGLDLEMGTGELGVPDQYYFGKAYLEALQQNKASVADLDDKVRRILRLIFKTAMNADKPWGSLASPEHYAVARKIAEESIVLLQNNDHLLPLNAAKIKTIAVIGENATRSLTAGGGSSKLRPRLETSPLMALQNQLGGKVKILYAAGYSHDKKAPANLSEEAVQIAAKADIVLYFGGFNKDAGNDTEGVDRSTMDLPYNQNQLITDLIKANKNTVITLIGGNAVSMPWLSQAPAVLQAWYGGSELGNAVYNVLFGKVNPSGKLPFTFPAQLTDCPAIKLGEFPGDSTNVNYKDDIFVGYRYYDTYHVKPLFPFGYGLSYTTFKLSDMQVSSVNGKVKVLLQVANTGSVAGAEVVQVYVNEPNPAIPRPEKELKAFKKVFLQPGEHKQVELLLNDDAFSYYDPAKKWTKDKGTFNILAGTSSADIVLKKPVKL